MVSSHNDTEALIPIGEAARLKGVSIGTLRRWEREGLLTSYRTPAGHRRYRPSDLDLAVSKSA